MKPNLKAVVWLAWIGQALFIAGCNSTGEGVDPVYDRGTTVDVGTSSAFARGEIENLGPLAQLDSSRKALEAALKVTQSYQYQVTTISWTGNRTETEIFVRDGKVVARSFSSSNSPTGDRSSYVEINDIGAHDRGFPPILLDSVYSLCRQDLSVDLSKNQVSIALDRNFILAECGHRPIGCADDCFFGVDLGQVRWVKYP